MVAQLGTRYYDSGDMAILNLMLQRDILRYCDGTFRLESNIPSHVQILGGDSMLEDPKLVQMIGWKLADCLYNHSAKYADARQNCVIGIPNGGATLAAAASRGSIPTLAHVRGQAPISCRAIRDNSVHLSTHGRWVVESANTEFHRYTLVTDVMTSGQREIESLHKLRRDGYPLEDMTLLVLVDRQQGAVEKLTAAGVRNIIVMYNLHTIANVLTDDDTWRNEAFAQVEEEIRQHAVLTAKSMGKKRT